MGINVIPLSRLAADPRGSLERCLAAGAALVVARPDERRVSIQSLEPGDDDPLVDELLASSPSLRALRERSRASLRLPFPLGPDA